MRVRVARTMGRSLTEAGLAEALIDSVTHYHVGRRWRCWLFVVMPDHVHGLLAFAREPGMSATIQQWKAYHARQHGVRWQTGYFDHRIRNDSEFVEKAHYLRRNPVAKGLCEDESEWRWVIGLNALEAM